ncbi:MAG: molybdopterin biosynthesis protein [Anaerolineales bacterium]
MPASSVYLEDIPLDEALGRWHAAIASAGNANPLPGEWVALDEACGRVTAEPVWARLSAPHYHAAAMDGYAIRAAETEAATETNPVQLALGEQAAYVDTGDAMPRWANAVIPIENVQLLGAGPDAIEIRAAAAPWHHVRLMGEDMVATELVLPANHLLRPVDMGAIAGCGHSRVCVRRAPRVAIIPTGTELVAPGTAVKPGDIFEFNSLVLAAQVREWGGRPTRFDIVADDLEAIRRTVRTAAAEHDLILLNAGSSKGSEDYSAQVVAELGELLVHGIAVRPGHPVILGMISSPQSPNHDPPSAIPIVGVPGYPVSAALTGEIFVEPLLSQWLGRAPRRPPTLNATLSRKVLSPTGDDEYLRVTVGRVGGRTIAAPLSRGAGVISSLVRADGIVKVPRFSEGFAAGAEVTVHLYRPPHEIENTIVAIGSHDLALDLLAQYLATRAPGMRLVSANVGSLGGLVALRRGECHLAGSHLLDPESGEYNHSYVAQYLPGEQVVLVKVVGREQGLIVPAGNPKQIDGLEDLARPDVRFVNRQRGAGTRVLLDYELEARQIASEVIAGYDHEEYTHLAVAAAVASGIADCGMGIRAAASAIKLDFVPLAQERYDLVIPRTHYDSPLLRPLLALLRDDEFQQAVNVLPGYSVEGMGEIVGELP